VLALLELELLLLLLPSAAAAGGPLQLAVELSGLRLLLTQRLPPAALGGEAREPSECAMQPSQS